MAERELQCQMTATCTAPVTHIGAKGYIYCLPHGTRRREAGNERTRMMRPWELEHVRAGRALMTFDKITQAEDAAMRARGDDV